MYLKWSTFFCEKVFWTLQVQEVIRTRNLEMMKFKVIRPFQPFLINTQKKNSGKKLVNQLKWPSFGQFRVGHFWYDPCSIFSGQQVQYYCQYPLGSSIRVQTIRKLQEGPSQSSEVSNLDCQAKKIGSEPRFLSVQFLVEKPDHECRKIRFSYLQKMFQCRNINSFVNSRRRDFSFLAAKIFKKSPTRRYFCHKKVIS